MFTEENLAAAQIAQIFGSELKRVQENITSESRPSVLTMDPKQILLKANPQFQAQRQQQNERLIQSLQKEAEAAYPISPPSTQPIEPIPPQPLAQQSAQPALVSSNALDKIAKSFESIAQSLELFVAKYTANEVNGK